jgi:hypothetical protein
MSSYTLITFLHSLDPVSAPWPVALLMLLAALYLAHRLYRIVTPKPKRRFHITRI